MRARPRVRTGSQIYSCILSSSAYSYVALKCNQLGASASSFSNCGSIGIIVAKKRKSTYHNVDDWHPCGANHLDLHPLPFAKACGLTLHSSLVFWHIIIQKYVCSMSNPVM